MSLVKVLPYFRECLCALGYEEWEKEINSENPPASNSEKFFKLTIGDITVTPARHTTFSFSVPVEVNLYFKTYLKPSEGMDNALLKTDALLCKVLDVKSRYGSELKSIEPEGIQYEAIDDTNDNTLKAVIDFNVKLELEYRQ